MLSEKSGYDPLDLSSGVSGARGGGDGRAVRGGGGDGGGDPSALLEGLTEAQREAVTTTEGPLLVLAAAGSGKTRVITRRVAYLLSMGVPPWSILALTFTNKAAGEMRERVVSLIDSAGLEGAVGGGVVGRREDGSAYLRGLTITTFHSLCARLLRRYAERAGGEVDLGVRPDYTIYDSGDQQSLVKRVLKEMKLSSSNWPPRTVRSAISDAKNNLMDAAAYDEAAWDFQTRTISKVYAKYQEALRAANAVDFDDLLLLTVKMLGGSGSVLAEIRERYQYLMIDEYQDTNTVQFRLASLIAGEGSGASGPNVCVVGDPDQSIYGWRGADISNILEFEERYPGARTVALGENFRSTKRVLAVADGLIKHNVRRKDKPLFSEGVEGEKPMVVQCRGEHHEADVVLDYVRSLVEGPSAVSGGGGGGGSPFGDLVTGELAGTLGYKDVAVFYRNNALSRVLEDTLRRAGVPYVIARGTAFYEREEVKDTIAYLRVVANPSDGVSLSRVINKPSRKIGSKSLDALEVFASGAGVSVFEACRRVEEVVGVSKVASGGVKRFVDLVDGWNGSGTFMGRDVSGSLAELVERVISESGLEKHYAAKMTKAGEADEDRLANMEELVSSAAEFEAGFDPANDPAFDEGALEMDAPPLLVLLRAYLESVALVADADKVDPARGAVTLMTLHAAKGLEFPAVAMVGLEEGLLPGMRSLESEESMEEERRLAFVGITRAMRTLLITGARYRTQRGMRERTIPSRFLSELPGEHVSFFDWTDEEGEAFGGDEDVGDPLAMLSGDDFEVDQRPEWERRRGGGGGGRRAGSMVEAGALVRHPQFGVGVVERVSGRGMRARATIEFEDLGRKTLVLQYARLTKIGDAAGGEAPF